MRNVLQMLDRAFSRSLFAVGLWLCLSATATVQAHLMVAQRGTLNIVGEGAFIVLSLPVSALAGVDDDGDGKLSSAEFAAHSTEIIAAVVRDVKLTDAQGARALEGLMLSRSPPDDAPQAPATQIVALGRFALPSGTTDALALDPSLRFAVNLFGRDTLERSFQVTVTRNQQTQLMLLTPDRPQRALLPSFWLVFQDYVMLGAEHIVMGFDHLLFLLVVLSAGWGWRHVFIALTTFTAGHAITLLMSVLGGISVSAAIVEPTIAATIIAMALFDLHVRKREPKPTPWLRVGLVFICSLIHGLGLASVLSELGLDKHNRLPSLAGFNVGIELGQLAIAATVVMVGLVTRSVRGDIAAERTSRLASALAIMIGSGWFLQRMISSV
jgi:HupE / UreJ protein